MFCIVMVGFVLFVLILHPNGHPKAARSSARDLIVIFHERRDAFDQLMRMAVEDAKTGRYFCQPYLGQMQIKVGTADDARLSEYKRQLSMIRRDLDWTIDGQDNVVRFIFAQGGHLAISPGWIEGIEYIPGDYLKEGRLVDDLDKVPQSSNGVWLQQIDSHWFLFYQHTE